MRVTRQLLRLSILIIVLASRTAQAIPLDQTENQIIDHIKQNRTRQIRMLEELVNVNSGTMNIPGIRRVGNLLRNELEQLGFKTRWADLPAGMQRAGTLIAERTGTKGKRLLLIGHLDTVFPNDATFNKFVRRGNHATGPGVIDDKGGDVILLYALKALEAAHALNNTSITVVLTGDEENSGKPVSISRKSLIDAARHSDVALDFEWAITADTAAIARRGIAKWVIEARGTEAHSSEIFQKTAGFGAIYEISRILDTMRTALSGERYLTFSPGLIFGGTTARYNKNASQGVAFGKDNVIAKNTMATGDLRFLTLEQKQSAEKQFEAIVNNHLPGTIASIKFEDGIPAMPPASGNIELLKKYSNASFDAGHGHIKPLDPGLRGAGDISHIASIVPANLAGLGALGTGAHSHAETINLDFLTVQTERAALLIYRLTR
ncbi:Carboxypeptidase G2 [Aquicella siphonis]|uniref:Carboxypeptidase G2 n=1 Tax=Aquicella siphonis TaxID=254247 RepID=A0A5E4PGU6_9COXI|nr:M20/M25/M40 family metallo-hydrolase [Aquicella siphonis]VVC75541.1 Carboxypeptidase G2 [Aquicella siphonis]